MQKTLTLKNGKKLEVRPLNEGDIPTLNKYWVALAQETIHTTHFPDEKPEDAADLKKKIEKESNLYLGSFDGSMLVGVVIAEILEPFHMWSKYKCEFDIDMLAAYQGNGLGTELMKLMEQGARGKGQGARGKGQGARGKGLHRMQAFLPADNQQGLILYLKCGFTVEGLQKETAFINGQWHDAYVIGKILD